MTALAARPSALTAMEAVEDRPSISGLSGPDPPAREPWTVADIERWLIMPMRQLRETSIFAGANNALYSADPSRPSATFDIIAFARTVLGKGSEELLTVTTWARIMAGGGDPDTSIAAWCREKGWQERTFHRRRRRACARITAEKNRVDGL